MKPWHGRVYRSTLSPDGQALWTLDALDAAVTSVWAGVIHSKRPDDSRPFWGPPALLGDPSQFVKSPALIFPTRISTVLVIRIGCSMPLSA